MQATNQVLNLHIASQRVEAVDFEVYAKDQKTGEIFLYYVSINKSLFDISKADGTIYKRNEDKGRYEPI